MNRIIEWFAKTKLFLLSVILLLPAIVELNRSWHYGLYNSIAWWGTFSEYYELVFLLAVPVLLPSFIFLFIKSTRTFTAWKQSLLIFLVIYIIVLWFVPWYDNDAFLNLANKSNVAKLLAFFYSLFSLIFITVLALKDRKPKRLKK